MAGAGNPKNLTIHRIKKTNVLKKLYLIGCLLLAFSAVHAQNRVNNIWYFGNAGIDFNTSPPTKLTNGGMTALEGTACVSDTSGHILFYTRGDSVYNKNHTVMPHGFVLLGSYSTAQPASIVKLPESESTYYIFSSDGVNTQLGSYSVVNMDLDGGLGDVATKNVPITDSVMECLLVVPHGDCNKYWVIYKINHTQRFESYLFDADGLHTPPVISTAGTAPAVPGEPIGFMAASPDYGMVSYAHLYDSILHILRFDNNTGKLTNFAGYKTGYPYGSCFSPDGKKLYLTASKAGPLWFTNFLIQLDLSSGNPATIAGGGFTVDSFEAEYASGYGHIQRGPDSVLYVARLNEDTLPTISAPDALGAACDFNAKGFDISPRISRLGLPAIAYVSTAEKEPDLGPDITQCSGPVTLDPKTDPGTPHTWSDGSTGPKLTVNKGGTYWVNVTVCGKIVGDTLTVVFQNETANFTMPNVITPNGDNMNDFIDMAALLGDCAVYDLKIMNRWGNVVYDDVAQNPAFTGHAKSGAKLMPGVYFYVYTQGNLKTNGTITILY